MNLVYSYSRGLKVSVIDCMHQLFKLFLVFSFAFRAMQGGIHLSGNINNHHGCKLPLIAFKFVTLFKGNLTQFTLG